MGDVLPAFVLLACDLGVTLGLKISLTGVEMFSFVETLLSTRCVRLPCRGPGEMRCPCAEVTFDCRLSFPRNRGDESLRARLLSEFIVGVAFCQTIASRPFQRQRAIAAATEEER